MSWSNRFFVGGIPDQLLGQQVCLVIEGDEMPEPVVRELKEKMKERVPRFEVPRHILFVKKFIETETGKINRNKTLNLFPAKSN